jgi:hypothetical protein
MGVWKYAGHCQSSLRGPRTDMALVWLGSLLGVRQYH